MRRTWIKIYVDQWLHGTMRRELLPAERSVWTDFLALAGDSPYEGKISFTEKIGYTDEQLADKLEVPVDILASAKAKMLEYNKIEILDNNVIKIVKWKKYQSEYDRQKGYRKKLQDKVTPESDTIDIDKDIDKDKNNIKAVFEKEFPAFWDAYEYKINRKDAEKAFMALLRKGVKVEDIAKALNGYHAFLKHKKLNEGFDQRKMYPASFLRSERWKQYIGFKYKPKL